MWFLISKIALCLGGNILNCCDYITIFDIFLQFIMQFIVSNFLDQFVKFGKKPSYFLHLSLFFTVVVATKNFLQKIQRLDQRIACSTVRHLNHYTRMFSVLLLQWWICKLTVDVTSLCSVNCTRNCKTSGRSRISPVESANSPVGYQHAILPNVPENCIKSK